MAYAQTFLSEISRFCATSHSFATQEVASAARVIIDMDESLATLVLAPHRARIIARRFGHKVVALLTFAGPRLVSNSCPLCWERRVVLGLGQNKGNDCYGYSEKVNGHHFSKQ